MEITSYSSFLVCPVGSVIEDTFDTSFIHCDSALTIVAHARDYIYASTMLLQAHGEIFFTIYSRKNFTTFVPICPGIINKICCGWVSLGYVNSFRPRFVTLKSCVGGRSTPLSSPTSQPVLHGRSWLLSWPLTMTIPPFLTKRLILSSASLLSR